MLLEGFSKRPLFLGIDDDSYLKYENIEDFKQWILSLKPKGARDK